MTTVILIIYGTVHLRILLWQRKLAVQECKSKGQKSATQVQFKGSDNLPILTSGSGTHQISSVSLVLAVSIAMKVFTSFAYHSNLSIHSSCFCIIEIQSLAIVRFRWVEHV